jgi:hypothetical protein
MALTRSSPNALELMVRNRQALSKRESFDKFQLLCDRILDLTPVDSGELRANYDIRYGLAESARAYIPGRTSPSGPVLPRPNFNLAFDPESSEPRVIGSAVPYVLKIEYSSWSAKAPHGMINIAIDEVYGAQ